MIGARVLSIVEPIIFTMLSIALFLTFFRLVRGPSLPDRLVALDLLAAVSVGFIAVYTIETGQHIFLDVAIVVALITFLGTVAFSQYIERRAHDD